MNILFLVKSFSFGGVEVVTATLANKFIEEGYNVSIFSMVPRHNSITDKLNNKVHFYEGKGYNASMKNVLLLRNIYQKDNINIVVNQWGLPFLPMYPAKKAAKGFPIKFISFYHNDPSTNGKLRSIERAKSVCCNPIIIFLLNIKWLFVRIITSMSMRYVYQQSDKFLVLSESYLKNLQRFIGVSSYLKLGVVTNPITIENSSFIYNSELKYKEIIYCGRVDYTQKRVDRIIDIWEKLEKKYPDWKLTIVGEGNALNEIKIITNKLGLKRIYFEGYQNPLNYYKRASILILTSDFEGFPLVLAESMSFGVVPIVYDSFASVRDIIDDGVNGLIVPKDNGSFSVKLFSSTIQKLLENPVLLESMAKSAIDKSYKYSLDSIYQQWVNLFKELS